MKQQRGPRPGIAKVRQGTFGRLELVNGYLSQNWMKATAGSWRQNPELSGGGQAYDSGAHMLNSLVWCVESDVDRVFAFVDNHGTPVDINSVFSIRFGNGVMASIMVSGNCPSNGSHMAFVFENGRVEVDPWGGSWIKAWKGNTPIKYPHIEGEPTNPIAEKASPYECGLEAFDDTRCRFDVRFYLVAILFIIFDLEIAFFIPWAVAFDTLGMTGFIAMSIFVVLLIVGFFVEWRRGALEWE